MVHVSIEGDRAVFEVEGADRLWALRSRLDIPLAHIIDVEHRPDEVGRWWRGWKVMGTDVPGLFAAGTAVAPKDIVDTVAEASAVAIQVAAYLRRSAEPALEMAESTRA